MEHALRVTRREWLGMINSPDNEGRTIIETTQFVYLDDPLDWEIEIMIKSGVGKNGKHSFAYANRGADQAQEQATQLLIKEKALEFID